MQRPDMPIGPGPDAHPTAQRRVGDTRTAGWLVPTITVQALSLVVNGWAVFWYALARAATDCRVGSDHAAFCASHPWNILLLGASAGLTSLLLAALVLTLPARRQGLKGACLFGSIALAALAAWLFYAYPTP